MTTKTPAQLARSPECEWQWSFLARNFGTEPEARSFVREKGDALQKQFTLHKNGKVPE